MNVIPTTCVTCGERKNMEEEVGRERRRKMCLSSSFFSTPSFPFLLLLSLSLTLLLLFLSSHYSIQTFRHKYTNEGEEGFS
jgi:hypothetical protein